MIHLWYVDEVQLYTSLAVLSQGSLYLLYQGTLSEVKSPVYLRYCASDSNVTCRQEKLARFRIYTSFRVALLLQE